MSWKKNQEAVARTQELLIRALTKGVTIGKKEKDKQPNAKVSKGCKY